MIADMVNSSPSGGTSITLREAFPLLLKRFAPSEAGSSGAGLSPTETLMVFAAKTNSVGVTGNRADLELLGAQVDDPLREVVGSKSWSKVVQALADLATNFEHRALTELFPGLHAWSAQVLRSPEALEVAGALTVRTENCLTRGDMQTWGKVADASLSELMYLRNFGVGSARDLLSACVKLSAHDVTFGAHVDGRSTSGDAQRQGILWEWLRFREQLESLFAWAASERDADRLGDVLQLSLVIGELPEDIEDLWSALAEVATEPLAGTAAFPSDLDTAVSELASAFDAREWTTLSRRLWSTNRTTLDVVGDELGVTRERARQIQAVAERRFSSFIQMPRFRIIRWRANDLAANFGIMAKVDAPETSAALAVAMRGSNADDLVKGLLLFVAGEYKERSGWWCQGSGLDNPTAALEQLVDVNGLLSAEATHVRLSKCGLRPAYHTAWLEAIGRFRKIEEYYAIWTGSAVDKCVALLAARGTPANAAWLVAAIDEGHDERSTRQRLYEDARLIRVNQTEWALEQWDKEEYTGISEEIGQRIDERGGKALLSDLIDELVTIFQVREASVKVYATAPMFVIEDGWIRRRGSDKQLVFSSDISNCRGAYRPSQSLLTLVIPVDSEILRGSGRSIRRAVGSALDVHPGRERTFSWAKGAVRVTWPESAAMGPSLGSIGELVDVIGALEGNSIRLDFDLAESAISATALGESVIESEDPVMGLQLWTGISDMAEGPIEALSRALGVEPPNVRRTLTNRGDNDVAALLPQRPLDPDLREDLTGLARALVETDTP